MTAGQEFARPSPAREGLCLAYSLGKLRAPDFWEAVETRTAIMASVPDYRLSKFQVALPTWAATEMLGAYLLDFDGAEDYLRESW